MNDKQETYLILKWNSMADAYNTYLAMQALGGYEDTIEYKELDEFFRHIPIQNLKKKIGGNPLTPEDLGIIDG